MGKCQVAACTIRRALLTVEQLSNSNEIDTVTHFYGHEFSDCFTATLTTNENTSFPSASIYFQISLTLN